MSTFKWHFPVAGLLRHHWHLCLVPVFSGLLYPVDEFAVLKGRAEKKVKKEGREGKMGEGERACRSSTLRERCEDWSVFMTSAPSHIINSVPFKFCLWGCCMRFIFKEVFYLAIGIHSKFVFSVCKVEEGQLSLLVCWHGSVTSRKKWWVE